MVDNSDSIDFIWKSYFGKCIPNHFGIRFILKFAQIQSDLVDIIKANTLYHE